jgi:putative phosphonate metabolism protein
MDERRFAIYFIPPADTPLYRFGASFIGYDCNIGEDLTPPDFGLDTAEWTELTRAPRTYGFHATLKAPFHLAPRTSEGGLLTEFRKFAATPRAIPVLDPVVRSLGQFVAVVPGTANPAIDLLAADCVTAFDRFRRPLDAQERHNRLRDGLSGRQTEHLDRWGYPYVFEDFRFHMTLTGPVAAERRGQIVALLQERFGAVGGNAPLLVRQLALLRQDAPSSRFRVICTAELASRG